MSAQQQKADPNLRRDVLRYLLIAALLGAATILIYQSLFDWATAEESLMASRLAVVIATLYVPAVPALWLCRKLWRLGTLVVRSQRFPPLGEKVIRDTPVFTGRDAVVRGVVLRALAVVTGASIVMTPAILWLLLGYVTGSHR